MAFDRAKAYMERLAKAENARVHIGLMGEYGAAERGNLDDPDVTVLDVGYLAEYGRKGDGGGPEVPAREPLRNTFEREQRKWAAMFRAAVRNYAKTGEQRAPLLAVGVTGANDVKNTYSAGMTPALAESTLRNRRHGGDTPFVDTGQTMRSNVAEVRDFDGQIVVVGREG